MTASRSSRNSIHAKMAEVFFYKGYDSHFEYVVEAFYSVLAFVVSFPSGPEDKLNPYVFLFPFLIVREFSSY